MCQKDRRKDTHLSCYPDRCGERWIALCPEEVIILGKGKTQTLPEWDKPVHFGTANWKVVRDGEDEAIKLRTESSSFALEKSITVDLNRRPISNGSGR